MDASLRPEAPQDFDFSEDFHTAFSHIPLDIPPSALFPNPPSAFLEDGNDQDDIPALNQTSHISSLSASSSSSSSSSSSLSSSLPFHPSTTPMLSTSISPHFFPTPNLLQKPPELAPSVSLPDPSSNVSILSHNPSTTVPEITPPLGPDPFALLQPQSDSLAPLFNENESTMIAQFFDKLNSDPGFLLDPKIDSSLMNFTTNTSKNIFHPSPPQQSSLSPTQHLNHHQTQQPNHNHQPLNFQHQQPLQQLHPIPTLQQPSRKSQPTKASLKFGTDPSFQQGKFDPDLSLSSTIRSRTAVFDGPAADESHPSPASAAAAAVLPQIPDPDPLPFIKNNYPNPVPQADHAIGPFTSNDEFSIALDTLAKLSSHAAAKFTADSNSTKRKLEETELNGSITAAGSVNTPPNKRPAVATLIRSAENATESLPSSSSSISPHVGFTMQNNSTGIMSNGSSNHHSLAIPPVLPPQPPPNTQEILKINPTVAPKPSAPIKKTSRATSSSSTSSKTSHTRPKRENLSEDQKRINHIYSEKRRRDLIKTQFQEMCSLVPKLAGSSASAASKSKSVVLNMVYEYLLHMIDANNRLRRVLTQHGVSLATIPSACDIRSNPDEADPLAV